MKTYQGSEIRNVAVVGHAHSGKTTLIAALLHAAKMTPTQGRVEDGSAVTAYDEEEVARGMTMQNAVAFAEWQGERSISSILPAFTCSRHEARAALLPVESAVVVVNAQNGVETVTERVWRYAEEANVPRIVVVNQMDHPKAGGGGGLSALIDDLQDRWGRNCVPVQLPISDAQGFHGVVDLVTMEAFYYTPGGDGRGKITGEIPASLAARAKAAHEALVELVAEGKDELMEEYFAEGHHPRTAPDYRAARGHPRRPHLPGAVYQRPGQHGHRPSAGLHQGLCAVTHRARADRRQTPAMQAVAANGDGDARPTPASRPQSRRRRAAGAGWSSRP